MPDAPNTGVFSALSADEEQPTQSPHAPHGLRYVSAVCRADGRMGFYYEMTRADGAHQLYYQGHPFAA